LGYVNTKHEPVALTMNVSVNIQCVICGGRTYPLERLSSIHYVHLKCLKTREAEVISIQDREDLELSTITNDWTVNKNEIKSLLIQIEKNKKRSDRNRLINRLKSEAALHTIEHETQKLIDKMIGCNSALPPLAVHWQLRRHFLAHERAKLMEKYKNSEQPNLEEIKTTPMHESKHAGRNKTKSGDFRRYGSGGKYTKKDYVDKERDHKWEAIRDRAFGHYGRECAECGTDEDLQVHHKTPKAYGGTNKLDNLIVLCETCHQEKHGYKFDYTGPATGTKKTKNKKVELLQKAIKNHQTVELTYVDFSHNRTKRTITPKEIYVDKGRIYVGAHCHLRGAHRHFRISRIRKINTG
jgi:hypothetical protein